MIWCWRSFLGLLLLAAGAVHAQPSEVDELQWSPPERYLLGNQLEVILQRDARAPEVAIFVSYGVGSLDDPTQLGGLAHLVEHMAFRGSRHVPSLQALTWLEQWGATDYQAYTAHERTVYYEVVPAEQLERVLWLESDRMAFTLEAMTAEAFELERAVVSREHELREAGATSHVRDLVARVIFPQGHAYSIAADADDGVGHAKLQDAQWLFQRGYRPDNATLVLVGDFDLDATKQAIAKYFGPIGNPQPALKRDTAPAVVFDGSAQMRIDAAVPADRVSLGWALSKAALFAEEPEIELLSGALTYLADERLVHGDGVASSASVSFGEAGKGGVLWLDAEATRGRDSGDLLVALTRLIDELRGAPVSASNLRALRNHATWALLFDLQSVLQRAHRLAFLRPAPRSDQLFDPRPLLQRVRALTAQDLLRAAKRYLRPQQITVLLHADKRAGPGGRLHGVVGDLSPKVDPR